MTNRREFIVQFGLAGGLLAAAGSSIEVDPEFG